MTWRASVRVAVVGALLLLGDVAPNWPAESATRVGIPALADYVVDRAHMLTSRERTLLSRRLGHFQRTTKHQIAIATVTDLGGEDIADYALRLGKAWGVGRRGYNDGVLIVVAPREHATRIEVGLGLGSRLPNSFCQAVLDRRMIPEFRRGHFAGGFGVAVDAIIERLALTEHAAPADPVNR